MLIIAFTPVPIQRQINLAYASMLVLKDPFEYYHRTTNIASNYLFPQVTKSKPRVHISSSPYVLHATPMSFFLI